jgi:hypothetical protein
MRGDPGEKGDEGRPGPAGPGGFISTDVSTNFYCIEHS